MTTKLKVVSTSSASDATPPSGDEPIEKVLGDLERNLREAPPYEKDQAEKARDEEARARKEARDSAIERVGSWLYGEAWIGELGEREYELGKTSGDLPADPHEAKRIARARFRSRAADEQFGVVFCWLQVSCNIDCSPAYFDAAQFETFWAPLSVVSVKDARHAAIRQRVQAGQWPGNGGTCTWKEFVAGINSDCSANYTEQTMRNDLQDLYPSGRP